MKKFVLFMLSILFVHGIFAIDPTMDTEFSLVEKSAHSHSLLKNNYQQFKIQMVNFEPKKESNYANLKRRRRRRQDYTMLYVAGGLAVATGALIIASDTDNYTSNSSSSVNAGIAIGGTLACGLFVAKYFIDRGR